MLADVVSRFVFSEVAPGDWKSDGNPGIGSHVVRSGGGAGGSFSSIATCTGFEQG